MVLQSKRIGRFFMIGVYDYTVIATYLSLLLGLGGLYSAAQNEPLDAMLCLMLAGLLDAFDGASPARKRTAPNRKSASVSRSTRSTTLSASACCRRHRLEHGLR